MATITKHQRTLVLKKKSKEDMHRYPEVLVKQ